MTDILLSTYNGEKYLGELLESLLSQTEEDWRLLMRDDGSTDSTMSIYWKYMRKDKRFQLSEDDRGNVGAMKSFELLMQRSRGEYIMFCDHDDVWLPEKIGHCMQTMKQAESEYGKETAIVVYSDLQVVDENLKSLDKSYWHYAGISPEYINDFATLAGNNCVTGCTMMINKAAKDVTGTFGKHAMMHDHVIALQVMADGGKLVKNEHADILYRQHGDNVVGAMKDNRGWSLLLYRLKNMRKIVKQNRQYLAQARDIRELSAWEYIKSKTEYKRKLHG